MSISIFSRRKIRNRIGELFLDTTLSEDHDYENDVTDYPIEDGVVFSDHVKKEPEKLRIQGLITLTPLPPEEENIKREDDSDRVQNAYNTLLSYMGRTPPKQSGIDSLKELQPVLLDCVTGLKTFTNMAITKLSFPFTRTTGQAVEFTIDLKKVKTVKTELTLLPNVSSLNGLAPNVETQASPKVNVGKKNTQEVSESSALADFFFGTVKTQTSPGAQQ